MKSLAKKITLLTFIAVIQVGFVAGITEASPFHTEWSTTTSSTSSLSPSVG